MSPYGMLLPFPPGRGKVDGRKRGPYKGTERKETHFMDRRDFLKASVAGAGVIGGLLSAGSLAGAGEPDKPAGFPPGVVDDRAKWTKVTLDKAFRRLPGAGLVAVPHLPNIEPQPTQKPPDRLDVRHTLRTQRAVGLHVLFHCIAVLNEIEFHDPPPVWLRRPRRRC